MKNIVNTIFFTFLGLLLISYSLYSRLFVNKIPKDLQAPISSLMLIFYLVMILLFLFLFFSTSIKLNFNKSQFSLFFIKNINKSIMYFHTNIIERILIKIINLGEIYAEISDFLINLLNTRYKKYLFLFIFDVFPKLFLLFIFFIEIFIFHKIDYFYKFSFLFLLPLLLNFLLLLYANLIVQNINKVGKCIIIEDERSLKDISLDSFFSDFCAEYFYLKNYNARLSFEFISENLDYEYNEENTRTYYVTLLLTCYFPSKQFFDILNTYRSVYTIYLNLVIFGLYFLGWVYVFYTSLSLIN